MELEKGKMWQISILKSRNHFCPQLRIFADPVEHNTHTPILGITIFLVFDLPKAQWGTLLPQLCPVVLPAPHSPFPPPMSPSWWVLAQWHVSSNLSCPFKRNQDGMAGAPGHQPLRYLNHRHLRLHNGRFWERARGGDGRKLYTAWECKTAHNQGGKSCINYDNTLRRHPPLHQRRETAPQNGEGNSQCQWGVWGGKLLAYFPWNRPQHAHRTLKPVALDFDKSSSWERRFRHSKPELCPKNAKFTGPVEKTTRATWGKNVLMGYFKTHKCQFKMFSRELILRE